MRSLAPKSPLRMEAGFRLSKFEPFKVESLENQVMT